MRLALSTRAQMSSFATTFPDSTCDQALYIMTTQSHTHLHPCHPLAHLLLYQGPHQTLLKEGRCNTKGSQGVCMTSQYHHHIQNCSRTSVVTIFITMIAFI